MYRIQILRSLLVSLIVTCTVASACDDGDSGDGTDSIDIDEMVSQIAVAVHNRVETILVVNWSQDTAADEVWLRYTFENDEWYESPVKTGDVGDHEEVILGIPEKTDVTFHVVAKIGDVEVETEAQMGTTGEVPFGMPTPTIESYDASKASPNRWLFGTVEATAAENFYYYGPFWLYIIDRQGRIVWYHSDLGDNPVIGFPRVSRDGKYIYYGNRTPWNDSPGFVNTVVKMTLDWEYFEEIEIPLSDNVDMTDDGSLLYNTNTDYYTSSALMEYTADGSTREIWNCGAVFGSACYSNTVNWNPLNDTVVMSFPYITTVVEIDRQTGDIVGQYGSEQGSYSFDPAVWEFGFQHYANITPEGTLMVSSHMPGSEVKHAFMEFEIDRDNEVLEEKWIYREGDEWPMYMGEAHRVPGGDGNVLANYGTGGVIKEIAPNKETAWYVKWDANFGDDRYNNMVGHCTLVDDLYVLVEGPSDPL